jgi:hypothetical protein
MGCPQYRDTVEEYPRYSKTCKGCETPSEFCPQSDFEENWHGDNYDGDSDNRDND